MLLGRAFKALQIWPHSSYPIIAASIPPQALPAPIRGVSMPFSTRSRFILPSCPCSCCSPHLPSHPLPRTARPPLCRSQANPGSKAQLKSRLVRQGPWQPRPLPASAINACGSLNMEAQAPAASPFLWSQLNPWPHSLPPFPPIRTQERALPTESQMPCQKPASPL